jgi:hypothetical protein
MMAKCNGKLPLVKFDNDRTYEGEWLNDLVHGRGILTRSSPTPTEAGVYGVGVKV